MSKARCNSLEDVRNISMQTLSFASVKHLLSKQVYEITLLAIDIDNIGTIFTTLTALLKLGLCATSRKHGSAMPLPELTRCSLPQCGAGTELSWTAPYQAPRVVAKLTTMLSEG